MPVFLHSPNSNAAVREDGSHLFTGLLTPARAHGGFSACSNYAGARCRISCRSLTSALTTESPLYSGARCHVLPFSPAVRARYVRSPARPLGRLWMYLTVASSSREHSTATQSKRGMESGMRAGVLPYLALTRLKGHPLHTGGNRCSGPRGQPVIGRCDRRDDRAGALVLRMK